MSKFITVVIFIFLSPFVSAELLNTKNFIVSVTQNCEEGNVTCDDVTYVGKSKKTGNSVTLKGRTMHRMCADGITPCQFIGYKFENGNVTYTVLESGVLSVSQNGRTLLEEQGKWIY